MSASHSTRHLRGDQRLDYWRQVVNQAFARLDVQSQNARAIDCQVSWHDLGRSRILHASGTPQIICRTAEQIDTDAQAHIILMFHQRGHASLMHQGRSVHLAPGAVVAMDTRSPYRLIFHGWFEQRIFRFPAESVCGAQPSAGFAATLLPTGFASNVLLAGLSCAQAAEQLPVGAEKSLLDLARMALAAGLSRLSDQSPEQRLRLARCYMDAHLDDPGLSSASAALALGISIRSLQKLFAHADDQPSAYILRRRLAKVHEQLADPHQRHVSIWHLAAKWGFNDPSHFSRAFKQLYGLTPRLFRLSLDAERRT